jgi:hypothetical protein
MISFTPGPWTRKNDEVVTEGGYAVAIVNNPTNAPCFDPKTDAEYNAAIEQGEVDADLIAAAPDLYAACDAMMTAIVFRLGDRELHCDHDWPAPITDALCEELDNMRQAIYKAQGRKQPHG